MSHDEIGGPVTRKERRKARHGKMQAAPRCVFSAAAHVRNDWTPEHLIERLEDRAHGYNGLLRQLLCTAAEALRRNEVALTGYRDQAISDMQDAEEAAPIAPLNISKRNQQPGRLSGSEREALKKFVELALRTPGSKTRHAEVMAKGQALLTKVRKRALSSSDREVLAVEELDDDTLAAIADSKMPEEGEVIGTFYAEGGGS